MRVRTSVTDQRPSFSTISSKESTKISGAETSIWQTLPRPEDVWVQPPEFWHGLGVWYDRIVTVGMADPEWMTVRLARLGRTFLQGLAHWLPLDVEKPSIQRIAHAIVDEITSNRRAEIEGQAGQSLPRSTPPSGANSWAQTLFLLDALVYNRSHQAIDDVAKLLLEEEGEPMMLADLTPRGRRLATAWLIYTNSPSDIEPMILYEQAERYSYNRLVMSTQGAVQNAIANGLPEYPWPQTDEVPDITTMDESVGHRHLASRAANIVALADENTQHRNGPSSTPQLEAPTGCPQALLAEEIVNQALEDFESSSRRGRLSRCIRILYQRQDIQQDTQIVFIKRVLRQRSIAEMERTLFGDEVEIIVLKFHNQMQQVEEHSAKGVGATIAQLIASNQLRQEVHYVKDATQTQVADLRAFLSAVRYGDDPNLALVELQLHNAPLLGNPILMLRGSPEQPLASALDSLEAKGLFLLNEPADIRHVGIAYTAETEKGTSTYIFKLCFEINDAQQGSIHYLTAHGSGATCRSFEKYIRTNHEITAIPAAR